MPFTTAKRTRFIKLLQTRGWQFQDGAVWSPSRGLWFLDSHFAHWSPSEMHEIFAKRSARIAKANGDGFNAIGTSDGAF